MEQFIEIDGRRFPLEDVTIVEVEPSDSRGRMEFLKQIAKALNLELADDAELTEAKVLEHATAVRAKADEEPQSKEDKRTLQERADADGYSLVKKDGDQVVVSKADFEQVKNDASEARKELRQNRFDRHYDKAVDELRLSTSDEVKARYQKLFDADPDTTVELLDALPKLANGKPRGSGKDDGTDEAPDGVDQDRHDLNERVEKRMSDKGESYETALDAVLKEDRG